MIREFPRMLAIAALAIGTLATPGRAQVTSSAQCVGGPIGCSQVDFFFNSTGGPLTIDFFSISLTSPGWRFVTPLVYVETYDTDFNFFVPTVANPTHIEGDFPFLSVLDPQLRFRTEFDPYGTDAKSLGYSYAGTLEGRPIFSGTVTPTNGVVPEPVSMVLLGTGLAGLGVVARRRRKHQAVQA